MKSKQLLKYLRPLAILCIVMLFAGCGGGGGGSSPSPLSVSIVSPAEDISAARDDTVAFQATASGGTAPYTYQWINGGLIITGATEDHRSITFNTAGSYIVTLNVTDDNGAHRSVSWTVTVGDVSDDVTPPSVISTFPTDTSTGTVTNTTVSIIFNENIDPDTITTTTFSISEGGDPVPGTVRCSGTTATFIPSAPLLYGKTYTALATTGVTDLAGNALASAHSWTFTTPPLNVSANRYHSVALKGDGTLWAWGYNNRGQLGDGTTNNSSTPEQVTVGITWVSVAAGGYHTVAIRNDGTIWAWGLNNRGQLGNGTTTDSSNPNPIQVDVAGNDWISIAAGSDFTVALKSDGTLWAWGDNSYGQLGRDPVSPFYSTIPIQVNGDTDWAAVSAGAYHCLALKKNGKLYAWGDNDLGGQLGIGDTYGDVLFSSVPLKVSDDTDWAVVVAGGSHSLALKSDGSLYAWGDNSYGQLGRETVDIQSTIPLRVDGAADWTSVACGYSHSLALKDDGTLLVWGRNNYGQLANGTFNVASPYYAHAMVGSDDDVWTGVFSGAYHSFATKSGSDLLWAWGYDNYGQLGDWGGANKNVLTPAVIFTLN